MSELLAIMQVYAGSNGDATKALYARLEPLGPAGAVATNLFRAHKASSRAKTYRGRSRGRAYGKKEWSLDNVVSVLVEHGEALGLSWGWKEDPLQAFHRWVLYVDLPAGQVSFHAAARGDGPDYPGEWDGSREQGQTRICRYVQQVLEAEGLAVANHR